MRVNRGLVFWGVALVTAGAIALAIQSNLIAGDVAREAWRLWPVVLIVIGLAVIGARTPFAMVATVLAAVVAGGLAGTLVAGLPGGMHIGCGGQVDDRVTADGSFSGGRAEVELDFNCGDLRVATADGGDWSVDAGFASGSEPTISSDDGRLSVEADDRGVMGFANARQDWEVTLPTDVELVLRVSANASATTLDLADARLPALTISANAGDLDMVLGGAAVGELEIGANAGSISMSVDGSTTLRGSIEMNAGSLDLCVADGASVEITVNDDNITFSHDLDASGLSRSGDTWRSGDGAADVVLEIEGNAASFSYDPNGGCS